MEQQPPRHRAPAGIFGILLLAILVISAFAYIFTVDISGKSQDAGIATEGALKSPTSTSSLAALPAITPTPSPSTSPLLTPSPSPLPLTKPVSSAKLDNGSTFKTFDVAITDESITPSLIVVNTGDSIQLNIAAKNKKIDFESPELKFYLVLDAGESTSLSLEASKAGVFTLRCKDFCPSEGKVSGKLVVQNQ